MCERRGRMIDAPIAHVTEDGRIHPLEEHLRGTARLAGEFRW
jgi:hypothetical protein